MNTLKIGPAAIQPIAEPVAPSEASPSRTDGGFLGSLKEAIAKANDIQLEASRQVDALMTGQSENIHQTMVALQQAEISFQLMMQIRNKLVSAYEEIQRMQV
ncbi:MAG: flagellar hook-basal body complex protein FliE [Nitrospirota bacterium]